MQEKREIMSEKEHVKSLIEELESSRFP